MHRDTKALICAFMVIGVFCVGLAALAYFAVKADNSRAKIRAEAANKVLLKTRGPQLFSQGQEVTIKTTGERAIVVSVTAWAPANRWHYWCRVAFGRKDYPIGVITNPTQITHTYELVDFYSFELEAR